MPDPRMMLQAFQSLMQDPAAMKAMMQGAQQMGIPPEMLQQLMAGGGGGGGAPPMPPGAGMMQGPGGGGPPMPPDMGGAGPSGEDAGPPPEGDPEQMASDQIDQAGNTWDGVDAPTQNDIQRLTEDPTPEAIKSFDEQFGEGAADKYLGGDGSEPADEPEQSGPPESSET